ncbi:sugar-binding transcriptional regulator [Lichenibacterium dinghuense]|uniref:sugar-binding transcriptional regulator n=1 Tax=Lichenibacterium dinghuense TaxID=2895977 RepID=UPI001F1A254F|nr:sugar-binding transcriptional regulator [Lichenibacterium sp. 6Y81]
MSRAQEPPFLAEDDASLAARAAWLHHVGRLTQSEVATRLNVPNVKAHRLIARAGREGMVRVFVDGEIARCVQLEQQLCRAYGLAFCEVAPNLDDEPMPLRALGVLGARYLRLVCERGTDPVIGLGNGRTLAACVEHLPRVDAGRIKFVSQLGGFSRRFAANPFDVINRIAERTGAEAYVLPVPFALNSPEDRAVLMAQRGVEEVFALARGASLRFTGIGTVDGHAASLGMSGMIEPEEFDEAARAGGRGEILGHFFDEAGRWVETDLSGRIAAMGPDDLRSGKLVAVAGGAGKPAAIRAVLSSGLLHGLLTDESTAAALLGPQFKL